MSYSIIIIIVVTISSSSYVFVSKRNSNLVTNHPQINALLIWRENCKYWSFVVFFFILNFKNLKSKVAVVIVQALTELFWLKMWKNLSHNIESIIDQSIQF